MVSLHFIHSIQVSLYLPVGTVVALMVYVYVLKNMMIFSYEIVFVCHKGKFKRLSKFITYEVLQISKKLALATF